MRFKQAASPVFAAFEFLDACLYRALSLYRGRGPSAADPRSIHFFVGSLGLGGAQRQLVVLVRFLVRQGFQCKVWVLERQDCFLADIEEEGAAVECLFESSDGPPPTLIGRLRKALRQRSHVWAALVLGARLRRDRPVVLQCLLNTTNVAGALAGRFAGVPVVVAGLRSLHPLESTHPGAARFQSHCYRLLTPALVDALVANSQSGRASFLRHQSFFPVTQVHVVPNGIDPEPQSEATPVEIRRGLGVPQDVPVIVWAGRFAPEKRLDVLLRALNGLADSGRQFLAVLAGEGQTVDEARGLAQALGLGDKVRFLGLRRDVSALLRIARVTVLTSDVEGFPNIAIEAQIAACPVVATRAGGTPEIVDDEVTGLLVPCGDHIALTVSLARLLDDPALGARMGRAGAERSLRLFRGERMGRATLALYQYLAQTKGASFGCPPKGSVPVVPARTPYSARFGWDRFARGLIRRARLTFDRLILGGLSLGGIACRLLLPRRTPARAGEDRRLGLFFFIPQLGLGGAQRALINLLNQIDSQQYRVELCTFASRGNFFAESIARDSLTITYLPPAPLDSLWRVTSSVTRRLRRARPDVVIGWMHWATHVAAVAGSLARVPLILVSFQGMSPDQRRVRPSGTSRPLDILTGLLSNHVLACSAACARSYQRWALLRRSKLTVLPNSCDVPNVKTVTRDEVAARRAHLGVTAPLLIAYVGRLASGKGVGTFLEVTRSIADVMPDVVALVIGEGNQRDELTRKAQALGLANCVRFLGAQPNAFAYIAVLDALVLLSESEGLPLVLLEAQSAGIPVVTTAAGGAPEAVIDGDTGFVVPVGDVAAAAARVLQLLRDPELRHRMGNAGRRHVKAQFNAPHIAQQFLSLCHLETPAKAESVQLNHPGW